MKCSKFKKQPLEPDYRKVVSIQEKRLNVLLNFGLFSCIETSQTVRFKWLFLYFNYNEKYTEPWRLASVYFFVINFLFVKNAYDFAV